MEKVEVNVSTLWLAVALFAFACTYYAAQVRQSQWSYARSCYYQQSMHQHGEDPFDAKKASTLCKELADLDKVVRITFDAFWAGDDEDTDSQEEQAEQAEQEEIVVQF